MMDTSKLAIIGWGAGGTLAADVAVAEDNVKVVVLNGGHLPVDPASVRRLQAAVLGNFAGKGSADDREEFEVFTAAMKRERKFVDLKVYPNASAGFQDSMKENFLPDESADSRQRTLVLLAKFLKLKPPTESRRLH